MDDKPLLRHQHVHRSRTTINELITSYYHTIPEPEPQIIPLLSPTGFQHIALIKQCKIDPALITALVERWRPETHTFHLPWGECTITLEDVALHLGIRVDGRVVTGPSFLHWDELCHELLGEVPPENARKGTALKLTWLLNMLRAPLPEEPTTHQLQCRCRAYIMYMIGGALIPDKSGNRVHLMYLNLLRDLNKTKKYSWGSACLANLYRELCRASSEVGKSMGGCVILLQSWAWYHMPFIAPRVPRPETTFPLAKRWSGGRLEYRATPHGDLVGYRSRIDHMESHEFSWIPYRGFEEHLPRCAYRDMEIWSACTAIICFSIVEWHQTNRVKLQFGLQQDIPVDPMNLDLLHQIDMRGNHYTDWMEYHAEWINIWKKQTQRYFSWSMG
ncbi:Serine/threonine-protein phosphatase 7 long form [Glycine max]|nr:Serine/threonine-protein phosphatase 7 long form [Glycine max]